MYNGRCPSRFLPLPCPRRRSELVKQVVSANSLDAPIFLGCIIKARWDAPEIDTDHGPIYCRPQTPKFTFLSRLKCRKLGNWKLHRPALSSKVTVIQI